jgi:epoxyqueuosine reductase
LVDAFTLDARRCISYLTIENHEPLIEDAPATRRGWVFGCDDCQTACPYNVPLKRWLSRYPTDHEIGRDADAASISLESLLQLRSGSYRRLVRGRALSRIPRHALIRNAALARAELQRLPTSPYM